jgi:catechol 2,3-dioxygenase-like lactoylglutathione lyase family enzyme
MKNNACPSSPFSRLKRRGFLQLGAAAGICSSPFSRLLAQTSSIGIKFNKLHCFEIRVADVERSISFYQEVLGMNILSTFAGRTCLQVGDSNQFMAIRQTVGDEVPAITKLGYSVNDYDLVSQHEALISAGFTEIVAPDASTPGIENAMSVWIADRQGTPELHFADANGVIVQLVDDSYCGGSGPLGNICETGEPAPAGVFDLNEINHFTAFVNDGAGANTYYQQAFDLKVQAYQGPGSPVTGIGDGHQFVMYAGPFPGQGQAPANIHHASFNIHDFDEARMLEKLTEYGLSARGDGQIGPLMHYVSRRMPERGGIEGGTPEVYFTDPDGILMQMQDVSYCGGGGYLGNECLL